MTRPIFTTSVESADNLGLDPATYTVTVAVHRIDGGPLSPEEVAAARAALARVGAPSAPRPTPAPNGAPSLAQTEADVAALAPLAAQIRAIATGSKPAAE